MARTLRSAALVTIVTVLAAGSSVAEDRDSVAAAQFLPADVLAAAGMRDGHRHVASFRALLDEVGFYESDAFRAFFRTPEIFAARVGLAAFAAASGTDEWGAVRAAAGRDLAIGLRISDRPHVLGILVASDPEVVELLSIAVQDTVAAETVGTYRVDANTQYDIACAKGRVFIAFTGAVLLVSSDRAFLTDALDAGLGKSTSFTASPAYRSVGKAVPDAAAAWGWLDAAGTRAQLARAGKWPSRIAQPLLAFIAGGWWHHLSSATHAIAWAEPSSGRSLDIQVCVDGDALPTTHRGFSSPARALGWSARDIPRYVGELTITRDWAQLFSGREVLLDRAGAGSLAKFLTNVGNFLGSLDLVEDILPRVDGPTRLVVAEQEYDHAAPTPALPAFALVAPLSDDAGKLSRQLEKAAQIAFTFINYQAMQQKRPTFMMETGRYREHRVLSTVFDEVPPKPTIRFNFQPAVAGIAGHYIVATSKALLEDVADRILTATRGQAGTMPDVLSLEGAAVARLLRLNREPLVTNHMLEKDVGRREATKTIDGLLSALDFLGRLRVTASMDATRTRLGASLRVIPLADAKPSERADR